MKKQNHIATLSLLFGLGIGSSQAAQLSIDMISGSSIDSTLNTEFGESLSIDIIIDDTTDLAGFEFDLSNFILSPTAITSGNIFGVNTFSLESQIDAHSIGFSETTLAFTGIDINTPTVLATVSFDVVNSGVGTLDLSSVVLSDSLGREITPVSLSDGNISAVPVPSAMLLMATGLSMLGLRKTKAAHA